MSGRPSTRPLWPPTLTYFFADGEVLLQRSLTTATTLSLYIEAIEQLGGITRYATLLLTVAAVDPPPLAAALVNASAGSLDRRDGRCRIAVGIRPAMALIPIALAVILRWAPTDC